MPDWDSRRWTPADREVRDPLAHHGCRLLGAMVRRRRYQSRLSQQGLADISGVSQSMISRLENGKLRGISLPTLGRIIGALDGIDTAAPPPRLPPLRTFWQ